MSDKWWNMKRDVVQARRARDEAIDRVEQGTNPHWATVAYDAGVHLARIRLHFTSEDVRQHVAKHYPNVRTHEMRSLGAIMRRLQKNKIVIPGGYAPSGVRHNHNRPQRIWYSQIFEEQEVANDLLTSTTD